MLSTVKHRGGCLLENWQPMTKVAFPSIYSTTAQTPFLAA